MISATIITLNEEDKIGKAVKSLKGLADEIILVDSGSRDKTVEVARSLGADIYSREFDNFANQKNWAAQKAKGDWILSIDADEEISADLAEEIKKATKEDHYTAYLIGRKNFILGKEIKYSRWSPDQHIWLWKKGKGSWAGDVHEEVNVSGNIGLLKHSKIHNSHKTLKSFFDSNNLYSTLEAKILFKKNVNFSLWKLFWEPIFEFSLRFFFKKGFLDGKEGFALAYTMAIYKLNVLIKLWELERQR